MMATTTGCISTESFRDSCSKADALTVEIQTVLDVEQVTLDTKLLTNICKMQDSQTNQEL